MTIETKTCYQLILQTPTPCFKQAGNTPCSANNCLVAEKIDQMILNGRPIPKDLLLLFLHSRCRISSLSDPKYNQEYWQRINSNNR